MHFMKFLFYNNVGDLLIWEGENQFLKSIRYKMIDCCSIYTYKKISIFLLISLYYYKEEEILEIYGGYIKNLG